MDKIKIGFVDDQRLFRTGFAKVLRAFKNTHLLIEAESGKDLFNQIEEKGIPDIVLIDLDMPELDGIKVARLLKEKYPAVKPIILTGHDDDELIVRLLQDDFCAYLHKDAHEEEVEKAILEVMENGSFTSERALEAIQKKSKNFTGTIIKKSDPDPLTAAEIEIIKLVCKGYKDAEIAEALNKGLRTIQNQRLILRKKINANTSADLISYAIKNKLVDGAAFYDYKKKFNG